MQITLHVAEHCILVGAIDLGEVRMEIITGRRREGLCQLSGLKTTMGDGCQVVGDEGWGMGSASPNLQPSTPSPLYWVGTIALDGAEMGPHSER